MTDTNRDQPPPAEQPVGLRQRAELRISGRVQGVYYRSAASEQARVLGLRGLVRNLPSGEVELIAEGPPPELQQLIAWCQLGPPAAQVDQVAVSFADATGEFADFRIVRSPV
ncbi:MAG TPA: acylphosphatase [Pseudomonadota bacterium]|nr:acylphosphatase [Pseudomonadota bacterium]